MGGLDKAALDRYLTTPPEDGFTDFVEQLVDNLPKDVYDELDEKGFFESEVETKLLNHFHGQEYDPIAAAKIYERYCRRIGVLT